MLLTSKIHYHSRHRRVNMSVQRPCFSKLKMENIVNKKHFKELSPGLYAFGRDEDAEDTLVVRDLYASDHYIVFGVKGVDKILKIHTAIWDMISVKKELLLPLDDNLKHVQSRDYARYEVGNKLKETESSVEIEVTGTNVRITLYKKETTFTIFNLKSDGQVNCGIIMNLENILELCNYLQKRFNFYNFLECNCVNIYCNDDFF